MVNFREKYKQDFCSRDELVRIKLPTVFRICFIHYYIFFSFVVELIFKMFQLQQIKLACLG